MAKMPGRLVAIVAGSDARVGSDIIVIGAHLDHLGDGFLGANDNASGVTSKKGHTAMRHTTLGTLDVGRIGLGAMSMSGYYGTTGLDDGEAVYQRDAPRP